MDLEKYENLQNLVFDEKTGFLIDSATGLVVDSTYAVSPTDGFRLLDKNIVDAIHYDVLDEVLKPFAPSDIRTAVAMVAVRLADALQLSLDYQSILRAVSTVYSVSRFIRLPRKRSVKIASLAIASVYLCCRLANRVVDPYRLVNVLGLEKDDAEKAVRKAMKLARLALAQLRNVNNFVVDHRKEVAMLIHQWPDPDVRRAALVLLKHANVGSRTAKSAAAALVYAASLIIGKCATRKEVANFYGINEQNLTASRLRSLGIHVIRTPFSLEAIVVPKQVCEELKKMELQISSLVKCV